MERDAFYFALLLLEHREFLYCSSPDSREYKNMRKTWKELISYVYRRQDYFNEEYLNWVIED